MLPSGVIRYPLLMLLTLSTFAAGQSQLAEPSFTHISTAQGLSESSVNAILQDRLGFMWFGTQDGLNRFDGYAFTIFRMVSADTNSISDNYIWCLLEDRDGKIWVGTLNGGLDCFIPRTEHFLHYRHTPSDSGSLSGNDVTALCQDSDGTLWVGTWGGGLNRFDQKSHRFTHFRREPGVRNSLGNDYVRCIIEDRSGILWIGTWAGLVGYDKHSGRFTRYLHDPRNPRSISDDRVVFVSEDSRGNLWVGTLNEGLNRFDRTRKEFIHYPYHPRDRRSPASNGIHSMCEDNNGTLWFGSANDGISRFDPATGFFTSYRHESSRPRSLTSDRVYSLYADRSRAVWVGTGDGGVNRHVSNEPEFNDITESPGSSTGLSNGVVRAICEDSKGALWVGTAGGGLNLYQPDRKRFQCFRHEPGNPASLCNNSVLTIFQDHTGTVWLGTEAGGLDRFDPETQGFVHYRREAGGLRRISGNSIMSIAEDREGTLWVGTTGNGLNRYDRANDTFLPSFAEDDDSSVIAGNIWAIHEDGHRNLWLGTWGAGVVRVSQSMNAVKRFRNDPADPASLSNNTVWCIYEGPDGILWLGTWGGGLDRFDPKTEKFTHFTKTDGLPNDVVYGILPDGRGNLWLSTNGGLSRFNPQTRTFRNYDEADGLTSAEFNQGAYCRGRDGTLVFGSTRGLTMFQPDSVRSNNSVPAVVLTSFKIFERQVILPQSISLTDEITVSYKDDFIAFEFAVLDFTAPAKNQYAYRLEGFDPDWVYCGTRRYAVYTGLPGGNYMLKVKGSNNNGVWNEEGTSVRIVIRPPFWRTWWFSLFAISAFLFLLYLIYRYRVRQLLEMERLRTRLASDLHDELASNLSSIAMFSNIIYDATRVARTIAPDHDQLLQRITSLSRESVTSIRDIIWAIDPKPETAYDLLVRLRDSVVPALRARNIRMHWPDPMQELLPSSNLSPEQRKHLWLLLKEALTNIIKHARCTEVSVLCQYSAGTLIVAITDNGPGFDPASASGGKGLATMKMRAALIGATLEIDSAPGAGATVRLAVKIS